MPETNHDYDLDDAFQNTQFVVDPSFKESLRGRLQEAHKTGIQRTPFSKNGWHRPVSAQTKQRDRYEATTLQPTARLIPAFGALILIALLGAIIASVTLTGGPITAVGPAPTAAPAEFTADDLQDIAGVWFRKYGDTTQMVQFNLDGTGYIDWATQQNGDYVEVISTSPDSSDTRFAYEFLISFEDGLLSVQNNGGWHDQRGQQFNGIFEAHITMDGPIPDTLTFAPKNDEARLFMLWKAQPWKWVGPIAPAE